MEVVFYARNSEEVFTYEVDSELANNVPILCVAFQNCDRGQIAFGAASSDEPRKPTVILLQKMAIGRLEKSPNYEYRPNFDPRNSVFELGYSGTRLEKYQPKSLDDKMHEICSTASFTRIYQDKGRKVEGRDRFIDRVTAVRFSLHWEEKKRFVSYGSSVWHYQEDVVNIALLQETADFRFWHCPNKVLLPESLHSLDEFIRKSIRKYGCHKENAKVIFPEKLDKKLDELPQSDSESDESESKNETENIVEHSFARTDDEILNRFKIRRSVSRHDEWFLYLQALPFHFAQDYLYPNVDSKKWDDNRKSYFEIKKEAIEYLAFAWDNANDKKGLSAARSIHYFVGWLWLLGSNNFDDLLDDYKYYGKPQLERISNFFNISWKELDDGVREN
jgi:hypothetical protein